MAELPKYQQTGRVFADIPQLDFANVRESFKRSQSMAAGLDRLSSFAGKFAEKAVEEQATQWAVDNQITLEQLDAANKQGLTMDDLLKSSGGGQIWQDTIRKIQGEQVRVQLENSGRAELSKLQKQIEAGVVDANNIDAIRLKINAIGNGLFAPLKNVDIDSYVKGLSSFGTHSTAVLNEARKKSIEDMKNHAALVADNNYIQQYDLDKSSVETATDYQTLLGIKQTSINRVYESYAATGDTANALAKSREYGEKIDNMIQNSFETYALSKGFVTRNADGLPDIMATMNKLSNGDLGEKSAIWAMYDQDKKDKVIQSVYTRLSQGYAAAKTANAAMKEQKEKENIGIILDLRTPGKVTGANRATTLKQLATDGVISPDQYAEWLEDKPKALSQNQQYLKDYAAYEIRTGSIKNLSELQEKYGKKLPINAIGDLLVPLASEDEKAADKFKSKYSGADYDPYHLQPTVQAKWLMITDKTDALWAQTNTDGTRKYGSKLEAAKAASKAIDESKEAIANIKNQKSLYVQFQTFKINPDAGGVIESLDRKLKGASRAETQTLNTLKEDYKRYLEYKQRNNNKPYNQLPDETKMKAGGE